MKSIFHIRRILAVCRKKGLRYWVLAIIFTALGWYGSHLLESIDFWLGLKYRAYVLLQNLRGGQKRIPQTTVVAIEDADYYGNELAARKPLKRTYLAKLISRIADTGPLLIAVDVDLRSPVPDSDSSDFADYGKEDQALFDAVCAVQSRTKVVLSKAINRQDDGRLAADPNIYDQNRACRIPGNDIAVGFLSLPIDLRRVPLSVRVDGDLMVDSFALAIARSVRPHQYPTSIDLANLPYGEFHDPADFVRVRASEVLRTDVRDKLRGQIVIVYGEWHVLASNRGMSVVDTFRTPVGMAGGAYVHANLVETLINVDLRSAPPESTGEILDVLIALSLSVAFAFDVSLFKKLGQIAATALLMCLGAWLFFQVFALFFDILPLLAAMTLHAIVDQVWEWREMAHSAKRQGDSASL